MAKSIKILKLYSEIYVNKCGCGWNFPALDPIIKKCPQCREYQKLCVSCGEPVDKVRSKYCNLCSVENKRIYNKYYAQRVRDIKKFKQVATLDDICDYDCHNCKFSDCLIPADKDDKYKKEAI